MNLCLGFGCLAERQIGAGQHHAATHRIGVTALEGLNDKFRAGILAFQGLFGPATEELRFRPCGVVDRELGDRRSGQITDANADQIPVDNLLFDAIELRFHVAR